MEIRNYAESDSREIADLFHNSVHSIKAEMYSYEQLEAWSPSPPDYEFWSSKLNKSKPYVATIGSQIVGFIELEDDGHIDCLYVHKNYQGQGIAGKLFSHVNEVAISNGIKSLYVEASAIAKPFFEKRGFLLSSENVVQRNGQYLVNYSMHGQAKPYQGGVVPSAGTAIPLALHVSPKPRR